jgi:hypothetical protein
MENYKAVTDLSGYVETELGPTAQSIHDGMSDAAATFDEPPVTMETLQANIEDLGKKWVAKAGGAYSATIAFNTSRAQIEADVSDLGGYVNTVAKGDESILILSNFPYYNTTRTADYSAPGAPTKLVMRQSDVSGSFTVRYRPSRRPSTNEVQTCEGNPAVESNWKTVGLFTSGKATVRNITPGTVIWVRVRTIGLQNVMGAWSDPAKLMVV